MVSVLDKTIVLERFKAVIGSKEDALFLSDAR